MNGWGVLICLSVFVIGWRLGMARGELKALKQFLDYAREVDAEDLPCPACGMVNMHDEECPLATTTDAP